MKDSYLVKVQNLFTILDEVLITEVTSSLGQNKALNRVNSNLLSQKNPLGIGQIKHHYINGKIRYTLLITYKGTSTTVGYGPGAHSSRDNTIFYLTGFMRDIDSRDFQETTKNTFTDLKSIILKVSRIKV